VAQVAGSALQARAVALNEIERVELPRPDVSSDFPVWPASRAETEESSSGLGLPASGDDPSPQQRRTAAAETSPVEKPETLSPPPLVPGTSTVIGYAVIGGDAPAPVSTEATRGATSPAPSSPPDAALRGLGSMKQTFVGMPSAPSQYAPEPMATPETLPVSKLFGQDRRTLVLVGVAAIGLVMGFSVVLSFASPASSPKQPAAASAPPRQPPASEPAAAVPDPSAGGAPIAAEAPPASDPSPAPAVVAAPEVPPLPEATAAPKAAPVVKSAPAPKPAPAKSSAPSTAAAAKALTNPSPAPASAPPGGCNPPYRVDFFGNKVLKPGCS